jgi:retron-type reverse transcriptase
LTKTSLISLPNLELAWLRITTARNLQHKRMFRHLYAAYEPGRRANLILLREQLKGSWKPTKPIRVFMPKSSGLLRPLTLLALDDQIVLQAIANVVAKQVFDRRRAVQGKAVFSNCLTADPGSIFFLEDWRSTYHLFKARLQRHLDAGNQWIAHFDLAAFYETISHSALQSMVAPAGGASEVWQLIREWLCVWTSSHGSIPVHHGIPQGPIASDFLAEVFLLPLDEAMKKTGIPYIRYVDDIRVLAKTEPDARRAAMTLELECRRLSLIPQSSKFSVARASNLTEALGALPSIVESTGPDAYEQTMDEETATTILRDAIRGRPARVVDKSRLRYVLYRSGPSSKVLRWTLRLMPRHPEHIDAFAAYLQNYAWSNRIMGHVTAMLEDGVLYDYVQGELWLIAARIGRPQELAKLLHIAKAQAGRKHLPFSMGRGLVAFFLSCRNAGVYGKFHALKRLRAQTPFVQSLSVSYLADDDFEVNGIVVALIHAPAPATGMVLAAHLVQRGLSVGGLGVNPDLLAPNVRNVFLGLGLIVGQKKTKFDQIGDLLRNRYGVPYWRGWKALLGENYQHALELVLSADVKYLPDRSGWLSFQNSFNDAVFRAFQAYLAAKDLPGAMQMLNTKGKLHTFGLLLDMSAAFANAHPLLAACLREGNDRRNTIPASHPFETKGGKKTKPLQVKERNSLKTRFSTAYAEIINYVNAHG